MPIARLKPSKFPTSEELQVPLAFTFIDSHDTKLPPNLQAPTSPSGKRDSSASLSGKPKGTSNTVAGKQSKVQHQDILMFDPTDGSLSLRRINLDVSAPNDGRRVLPSSTASVLSNAVTDSVNKLASLGLTTGRAPKSSAQSAITSTNANASTGISGILGRNAGAGLLGSNVGSRGGLGLLLGGGGSASKNSSGTTGGTAHKRNSLGSIAGLGTAPSAAAASRSSTLARMLDVHSMELIARDNSVVANWSLQRRKDWYEVRWKLTPGEEMTAKGKSNRVKKSGDGRAKENVGGRARAPTHTHTRMGSIGAMMKARQHIAHEYVLSQFVLTSSPVLMHFSSSYLAHSELSTCSRSPQLRPRTIYLSHQFTFRSLGEGYNALLRGYRFGLSGNKITVRREVEISAFEIGTDHFVGEYSTTPGDFYSSGSSGPQQSPFDAPLASALSDGLVYNTQPHAVLPMLPNGGTTTRSLRNSVPMPIRSSMSRVTKNIDVNGVAQSLGMMGRGMMQKVVRSPPLLPVRGSAGSKKKVLEDDDDEPYGVPLEFDEEDEDFMYNEADKGKMSDNGTGTSVSTADTSVHLADFKDQDGNNVGIVVVADPDDDDDDEDEAWHAWDREDKFVVEEEERFDEIIPAAGFMDEEQERGWRTLKGRGYGHGIGGGRDGDDFAERDEDGYEVAHVTAYVKGR